MTPRRPTPSINPLRAIFTVLLLLAPSAVHAQEECGDLTCDKGLTCASIEIPCAASDEDCDPEEELYCTYDTCETDADCADYLVCYTRTEYDCPEDVSRGCQADESDDECADRADAIREAECEGTDYSECRARWHFACETDDDCGSDGFECVRDDAGEGYCHFEETCETDSDCPSVFSCESVPVGPCMTADGGEPEDPAECEYDEALFCVQPVYSRGVGTVDNATAGEGASSAPTSSATSGSATSGSTTSGSTMSDASDGDEDDADADVDEAGGCGVSNLARGTNPNVAFLVVFGIVAVGLSGAARRRQLDSDAG